VVAQKKPQFQIVFFDNNVGNYCIRKGNCQMVGTSDLRFNFGKRGIRNFHNRISARTLFLSASSQKSALQALSEKVKATLHKNYQEDAISVLTKMSKYEQKRMLRFHKIHPMFTNFILTMGLEITEQDFHRFVRLIERYPEHEAIVYFMAMQGIQETDKHSIETLFEFSCSKTPVIEEDYFYLYRIHEESLQEGKNFLSRAAQKTGLEKSIEAFERETSTSGVLLTETQKAAMHRAGGGRERYGIPLTADMLSAASFVAERKLPTSIIYRLRIPCALVRDVNAMLKNANMQDPVASLGGGTIREYLVWHTFPKEFIVDEMPYPFKKAFSYSDLGYGYFGVFLEKNSPKRFNCADWRGTMSDC